MKEQAKISVDFDGTLTLKKVQSFIKLISPYYRVVILTTRNKKADNSDLYELASKLKINDVIFTNGRFKAEYLKNENYTIHLENDWNELLMAKGSGVEPVSVLWEDWFAVSLRYLF